MRYDDGYHRFVFTGDAAESMEKKLNNVQCDVFQAGHHGSAYSNSDNLLSRMKASYVVVSCGKDNMYGHPHKEELLIVLMNYVQSVVFLRRINRPLMVKKKSRLLKQHNI